MDISAIVQGQNLNISNLAGILERVNVGDVIKAKILEMTSDQLILKLFDGSEITAKAASNIDGKKGDFIDLKVTDKVDGKLVLETVKNPSVNNLTVQSDNEIKKQLLSMGLQADDKNMEIANEIKTQNLPLTQETFDKVINTLSKFTELSPAKAVFLLASNLGIEEKNISALNQLVDGKAKIAAKLGELLNTINNIDDPKLLEYLETKLAQTISPKTSEQTSLPVDPKAQSTPVKNENASDELKVLADKLAGIINDEVKDTDIGNLNKKIEVPDLSKSIAEFLMSEKDESQVTSPKLFDFLKNRSEFISKLPPDVQNEFKELLDKAIANFKNNLKDGDILKALSADHSKIIEKTLKSAIHKAFENFFVNIDSDTLKDDIKVKNLFKDIYEKLEIIKESVDNSSLQNKGDILKNVDNMQNNIRFMNELGSHNTYIQIPLNVFDKNTTGELYVLKKNSKRNKIDPENVTMYISLDTNNIGRIDSLIGVSKKNLTINMRVESKEIIDFIKSNYKDLYNKLKEKGYNLVDIKYRLLEEEPNITNINSIVKNAAGNNVSIDYKL